MKELETERGAVEAPERKVERVVDMIRRQPLNNVGRGAAQTAMVEAVSTAVAVESERGEFH